MPRDKLPPLDQTFDPLLPSNTDLTIPVSPSKALSPAHAAFNRQMKALEKARRAHHRTQIQLDKDLKICNSDLMPLLEANRHINLEIIFATLEARNTTKLTVRRHKWLSDLISEQAHDLLDDPIGFSGEEITLLEAVVAELGPSASQKELEKQVREEFETMREIMEEMAKQAGVDLDLSGLNPDADPVELERQMQEQFEAAEMKFDGKSSEASQKRKPTKAALDRERLQREVEEAKTKDFKSLYKQLAKVLHPDLETDPKLKAQKETWMKRLTTARKHGDLRDMLAIEMEWLGKEANNLMNASDEKLKIYAMVLKQQTNELKQRTYMLQNAPEYTVCRRFWDSFDGLLHVRRKQLEMDENCAQLKRLLATLRAGGARASKMIHAWADTHARDCGQ